MVPSRPSLATRRSWYLLNMPVLVCSCELAVARDACMEGREGYICRTVGPPQSAPTASVPLQFHLSTAGTDGRGEAREEGECSSGKMSKTCPGFGPSHTIPMLPSSNANARLDAKSFQFNCFPPFLCTFRVRTLVCVTAASMRNGHTVERMVNADGIKIGVPI
ncbi:hypothetical protein QR685DRAFT_220806 [Neurospora intermedia]|uniref:Secreted protein n=1 Tax=Neurospora intermedia TaxID=5142 RepID=A0ABR3DH19_NEUIN